jgi:hypothetical protein
MRDDKDIVLLAPTLLALLVAVGFCLWLASCTTAPTCHDNPRNMQCMSADQLEKELNQ